MCEEHVGIEDVKKIQNPDASQWQRSIGNLDVVPPATDAPSAPPAEGIEAA